MEYTIVITEEELGVIARALMEMPYKTVAPLFDKLNQQITEQKFSAQAPVEQPQEESPAEAGQQEESPVKETEQS